MTEPAEEVAEELRDRPWSEDWRVMWADNGTIGLQASASAGDAVDVGRPVEWFAARGYSPETLTPDCRMLQFRRHGADA